MLSKNTLKFIKSLQQKKFRKQENAFFVEGSKNVTELLDSDFQVTHLLYTEKFAEENRQAVSAFRGEAYLVTQKVLESAGSFQTNDSALAVAKIKQNTMPIELDLSLVLALDDVRDPGNLGTIIRIADWYGIKYVICSEESADCYNPKVLNSSMGSFSRVNVLYTDLYQFLEKSKLPVYGAFLEGENIYKAKLPAAAVILMGNESNGISEKIGSLVNHKITIPRFGLAESLNVAIATAIICDNFKRL
ncbi:RNA methyltransferase [Belliella sp. DSM 107340]|uniref:RNA methyltransferase n=1 Tax=Belliella calami TaxID=2923436 RepID=A0ABS9UJQ9_9BACT|nr:RNA methyltransferase [Belliella calami]MCH7396861.1 RNA methyltransferase [Belliella calami]